MRVTLATLAFSLSASVANADLIGSTAYFAHQSETRIDAQATVVVEQGAGDLAELLLGSTSYGPAGYTINLDAESLSIDFFYPGPGFSTSFNGAGTGINGLYISDPALSSQDLIDSAAISQTEFRFSLGRLVLFDSHSVGLDFQNLRFGTSSFLEVRFSQPQDPPPPEPHDVPIPATFSLIGIGIFPILGVLRLQRRRPRRRCS